MNPTALPGRRSPRLVPHLGPLPGRRLVRALATRLAPPLLVLPLLASPLLVAPASAQPAGQEERVEFLGAGGEYPFSEAVRVGRTLYLSGAIGIDPETGELVPGGIQPETRQTLENIRATLERYGASMDRVVKCTAMLADMEEWPAMNEVWAEAFDVPYPARSAFGATALALGARVEIECIAALDAPAAGGGRPGGPPEGG